MYWPVGVSTCASLIFTGKALRTRVLAVSDCAPRAGLVHSDLPMRWPALAIAGEVTLKMALTLAPGAMGSGKVLEDSAAVQPGPGSTTLSFTPLTGVPVVLVK